MPLKCDCEHWEEVSVEGIVRIARPLSLYLWLCYIIKKIITNLLKGSIFKFQLKFPKLAKFCGHV